MGKDKKTPQSEAKEAAFSADALPALSEPLDEAALEKTAKTRKPTASAQTTKRAGAPKNDGQDAKSSALQTSSQNDAIETNRPQQAYQVLARKYRPHDFDGLIGQEAMVRTLSNAIESGRLAHAFLLTGVRGVGKTTTARIIAKALNCTANAGPSLKPCGQCDSCQSIAASRHVDVIEMDAASRTGVGDVREIIDSVRYAPVSARYKIYIIDEVHMLSSNAFNALLKTLEEPPARVKFIFATTEIRKIPITVLSRCQRFDLKRVDMAVLQAHLRHIVDAEKVTADDASLALLARAAEGSVRDSQSLLDQAIAHMGGFLTGDGLRDMLGLADRAQVSMLFEQVMQGDAKGALEALGRHYKAGADPAVLVGDMLELCHWLTRLKIMEDAGADALVSENDKKEGRRLAESLSMMHLTRAWQMLLNGLGEVRRAPSPLAATEMLIVRLCYAANMPSPEALIKKLSSDPTIMPDDKGASLKDGVGVGPRALGQTGRQDGQMTAQAHIRGQDHSGAPSGYSGTSFGSVSSTSSASSAFGAGRLQAAAVHQLYPVADTVHPPHAMPISFAKMVALFEKEREAVLAVMLKDQVRLIAYQPGRLTLRPAGRLPQDFASRVKACLKLWTGVDWLLVLSQSEEGHESLREQEVKGRQAREEKARREPLVGAFLTVFPTATLAKIHYFDDDQEGDFGDAMALPLDENADFNQIEHDFDY